MCWNIDRLKKKHSAVEKKYIFLIAGFILLKGQWIPKYRLVESLLCETKTSFKSEHT